MTLPPRSPTPAERELAFGACEMDDDCSNYAGLLAWNAGNRYWQPCCVCCEDKAGIVMPPY